MLVNIKKLYNRYRDVIPYLFFGVCTTVVKRITYWCMANIIHARVMLSTVVAWVLAVLFAYYTNRKWVFKSEAKSVKEIGIEMSSFLGCRFATRAFYWGCTLLLVNLFGMNDIIKFATNVMVIVLNYVASKMFIFTKKKEENQFWL